MAAMANFRQRFRDEMNGLETKPKPDPRRGLR